MDLETWWRLFHQLPDAVLCLDNNGRVVFYNSITEELLGYEATEFNELMLSQFVVHPESMLPVEFNVFRQLAFSSNGCEILLRAYDHSLIPVLLSVSTLPAPGGTEECFYLAIFRDIRSLKQAEARTIEEKKLFEMLVNNINEAVFLAPLSAEGVHGNFTLVNDEATRRLGYSKEELLQMNARTINPAANLATIKAFGRHIRREGNTIFEAIHVSKDGIPIPVEVVAKVIAINGLEYVLSVVRDLREHKRLQQTEARFGRLMDRSWDEIYVFDCETLRFLQVNKGALDNLGYSNKEIQQLIVTDIKPEMTEADFRKLTKPLFEGHRSQIIFETVHKRSDGSIYPVEIRLQLSHSEVPPVFMANVQDITERKKAEEHLQYLANYDSLTGLPNRTLFLDRLNLAMENSTRTETLTALIYLDLDEFKSVNDTLGHLVGDELLREVAKRLSSSARKSDTVARLGGDEFTIVVSNIRNVAAIEKVAQKIIKSLNRPFMMGDYEIRTSSSLGITIYPFGEDDDVYTMVKQADSAMYQAKRTGKNNFQYYTALLSHVDTRKAKVTNAAKSALPLGQFEVYYQPRINLQNKKIIGAEALLRLNHPDLGMVSPAEFIPIVETQNLIHEIGEWVLIQACKQLRGWLKHSSDFRMSVNVSARQLESDRFVNQLQHILQKTGVPPENLEIEITEGILVSNSEQAGNALRAIKEAGVKISLDDFGSGYSSLNYLKRFAIDILKIDRSFVMDIGRNPDANVIVKAIIGLAQNLRVDVTAEGIEDPSQLQFLKESGCREGQGFYFSRPVPVPQFEEMLFKQLRKVS